MDPEALNEQIRKLHEELANVRRLEPRSSQLLGEIMSDIKRLTDESSAAPASPGAASAVSLPDRLEEIAVQFEADHPTLVKLIEAIENAVGELDERYPSVRFPDAA